MTTPKKINPYARSKSRRLALQAIYQWQAAKQPISEIIGQYSEDREMARADREYFQTLLEGVLQHYESLDEHLKPFVDRPIAELDPIELAILRIGAYELAAEISVPYRVAINEAVELAKTFGATDGHKYINGVLDQLARKLRSSEW